MARARTRVLVVDDEPDILLGLTLLLQRKFDVLTAKNGAEALTVLEHGTADVIVLDLMMPVMDGATFKREIDARSIATPVIVLSAYADVAVRATALGAAGFLEKPLDVPRLEAMIDRVCGGSPADGAGAGSKRRRDGDGS